MATAIPTIQRKFQANNGAAFYARSPTASPATTTLVARLDASMMTFDAGDATSMCALGFDAGKAPAKGTTPISEVFNRGKPLLLVSVHGLAFIRALCIVFIGAAQTRAHLSIEIQEFSPAGTLIRSIFGPRTALFDMKQSFIGSDAEFTENKRIDSTILAACVPGNSYRCWIRLDQHVEALGFPLVDAVSNASFDFMDVFFTFL